MPRPRMKALKVLAGLVLCLYAAFLGFLFVLQRALIYPGTHIAVPGIPPSAPGFEVIPLQTSSGSGEAIFLPAPTDERQPVVIFGHGNGEVIGINTVSMGSLTSSVVHPRECFKPAILSNAAALICGHNHPSSDCQPSREDRALTTRLVEAGKLLGIAVLDHIIIGGESKYFSFADEGLL